MFYTTLHNLAVIDHKEWSEAVGKDEIEELLVCELQHIPVEVISLEVDGGEARSSYFNLKLPSGLVAPGIAAFHLNTDIAEDAYAEFVKINDQHQQGVSMLFLVEMDFPSLMVDSHGLDAAAVALLIKQTIAEKMESLQLTNPLMIQSVVREVSFQAECATPK